MGAVRMRVQTADKNITSNLHPSSLIYVLTLNHRFWPKYKAIAITMLPSVKTSIPCCPLTSKYTYIFVFTCKQCLICAYFSHDSDKMTFSLEKALLWIDNMDIMDLFLTNTQLSLHKMLIDGLEWCGLL